MMYISFFIDFLILFLPIYFLFIFYKQKKKSFLFLTLVFLFINLYRFLEFFYIKECSTDYLLEKIIFKEQYTLEPENILTKRLFLCPFTTKKEFFNKFNQTEY